EAFVIGIPMLSKAQHDRGEDLAEQPALGTGPYLLKEWVRNVRVVVAKNPNYWDGPVNGPDEIVYRFLKGDQTRVTALLKNEIQIASNIPAPEAEGVNGSANARIREGEWTSNQFLAMAPKFEPWNNLKLRQAVNYAIDKDTIIQSVLGGHAQRLDAPVGP